MEQSRPFISIIIPTYERAAQLSDCLGALTTQDYPRECFEVLVVDDGSVASSECSVEPFQHQLNVRLLKQRHSGPAAARNYGAAHAKGSFLAFTDDDCEPAPDWLENLAKGFLLFPGCALGGRTVNKLANNPYSAVSQLISDYLYARWNPDPKQAAFLISNNFAVPVKCFQSVGGFDVCWTTAAGEDRDLCDRLIARGYRLIYTPEALVAHAHPLTFRTFWRQHFNYGRGAYRLHQLRARRKMRRFAFEPVLFYLKMCVYPFDRTRGREAAIFVVLVAIAQAANAAGWIAGSLEYSARPSEGGQG